MNWTFPRFCLLVLLLFSFPAIVTGTDLLRVNFGEGWELVGEKESEAGFVLEYLPFGQTVDNWSHFLLIEGSPVRVKPHRITLRINVDRLEKRMRAQCPNTALTVMWEKRDRVVYHWRIFRCSERSDQAGIGAYIAGDSSLFRVEYTKKTSTGLGAADKNWWEKVLLDAEVEEMR